MASNKALEMEGKPSRRARELELKLKGYDVNLFWFRLYKSSMGYRWAVRHWYFPFWHWSYNCFVDEIDSHYFKTKEDAYQNLHMLREAKRANKWRPVE